jgi:hypothetical protein
MMCSFSISLYRSVPKGSGDFFGFNPLVWRLGLCRSPKSLRANGA